MQLRAGQVRQFREHGYTTVPGFFELAEVRAMQAEVARWLDESQLRDVSTDPGAMQNFQLIPLYDKSDLFRAVPFAPKVIEAVGELIGHPVLKILDQMFTKPPQSGMGTNWHTDNAYFELADPMAGTAMWIAVDDASEENGTLKVVPDAVGESFAHVRDPASDHHIRTHLDERRAVHCELAAGGVVFFCFGTPHATGDNLANAPRSGVGLHFVNLARIDGLTERWQQVHLTGAQASGGRNEYGAPVDFDAEVARVLNRA